MIYKIELTDKQRKRFKHMNKALIKMGMGFDILSLLEPVEEAWKSELEKAQSDAYDKGFDEGYEDGKSDAAYNTGLIGELKAKERQEGYDVGYTQAIADYRKFERFFNSVGGIEVFEDIRNADDGTLSIDMILQYLPMPEIMARIRAYEEKKKSEEEIKVGDEVVCNCPNEQRVIITAKYDGWVTFMRKDGACYSRAETGMKKTGKHFDAVEQLLDKLRGTEDEHIRNS